MQTILGAGGSIGTELALELKKYTDRVRIVSRNPEKVNDNDELIKADLTDPEATKKAVEGSEVVYLTVGLPYFYKVWNKAWPLIMNNCINACKLYGAKMVFFDNIYLYDREQFNYLDENTTVAPSSKKGEVRANIAEKFMNAVNSKEIEGLIARSPDFIAIKNSIPVEMVYKSLVQGKRAQWFSTFNKKHTFIYAPDAARASALLGNTPEAYGQVWHLPSIEEKLTGDQWIDLFARHMQLDAKKMTIPIWLTKTMGIFVPIMKELGEMAYQYDRDYIFVDKKFREKFDFQTVSADEAVSQIVSLLNQNFSGKKVA